MLDLKWYMIFRMFMVAGFSASEIYKENQKTKRYEICMKELKDVEKCKSVKGE